MRRRRNSGVSMIELIIAVAVLVLGMIALMSAVISSSTLSDASRESVIAYEAARAKVEEIRNYSKCRTFYNIFKYYKPGAVDPVTLAPTCYASVSGLNPIMVNGSAQPVLQVIFPVNLAANPALPAVPTNANAIHLKEDLIGLSGQLLENSIRMGMPKDLNRNAVPMSPVTTASVGDTGTGTGVFSVPAAPAACVAPLSTETDLDCTYKVLPVLIRVQWETIGKRTTQIEVSTFITEK